MYSYEMDLQLLQALAGTYDHWSSGRKGFFFFFFSVDFALELESTTCIWQFVTDN